MSHHHHGTRNCDNKDNFVENPKLKDIKKASKIMFLGISEMYAQVLTPPEY